MASREDATSGAPSTPSTEPAEPAAAARREGPGRLPRVLTAKVVVLYLLLMTILIVWTEYSVLVVDSTSFNSLAPSITSVFALAAIALCVNPALRLLKRGWDLSGRELVMLYAMLMVSSPVSSIGLVHFLLPTMASRPYFAEPENRWDDLFGHFVPKWVGPTDEEVVKGFWESSVAGVPWGAWATPFAAWAVFVLALYFTMVCLNTIIREQWIRRERLTFPLVYLPLELTREARGAQLVNAFLRNPLTWIGFVLAIIPQTIAGLHVYYPSVPELPVKAFSLRSYLREPPWNAVGTFNLSFYPCMIGFSFLLTTEVSFSVWFFYLLTKAERIFGRGVGLEGFGSTGQFPFEAHQSFGAWLVLILFGLWIGRSYFADVLQQVWRGGGQERRPDQPMSYRTAAVGALAGLAIMVLWANRLGMALWLAVLFFGVVFILFLGLTRIRAEAGLGCITGPLPLQDYLIGILGTKGIGAQNLTAMQHFEWFSREFRGAATVMPCQLEAFKMADSRSLRGRELLGGLTLAVLFTMVVATFFTMRVAYLHGGVTLNNWRFLDVPVTPFRKLANWIGSGQERDWPGIAAILVGVVTMIGLTYMRISHVWWPWHPVGYALSFSTRTVHWIWFPALLGWVFKVALIKYGGLNLYRRTLPFFLGLILGDFFIGGVFGVAGALVPRPGYCVFP